MVPKNCNCVQCYSCHHQHSVVSVLGYVWDECGGDECDDSPREKA